MFQMMVTLSNSVIYSGTDAVFVGLHKSAKIVARSLIASIFFLFLSACESATCANAKTGALQRSPNEAAMLTVDISVEQHNGSIILGASLNNNTDKAVSFLPWGTPFEGAITADFLSVRKIGASKDVLYIGIMVKRVPPSTEDYVVVGAGESLEKVIDISKSYDFCANTEYQIAYSQSLMSPETHGHPVNSNVIRVRTAGNFKTCS